MYIVHNLMQNLEWSLKHLISDTLHLCVSPENGGQTEHLNQKGRDQDIQSFVSIANCYESIYGLRGSLL